MELLTALIWVVVGFTTLVIGGESLVKASVSIAARFRIDPAVIGLTIIALGTSAPEIFTSLIASLKGVHNIAMGNIIGSNLFNILVILGVASLVKVIGVDKKLLNLDLLALILFTLVFTGAIYNQFISIGEGIVFFLLLTLFFIFTIRLSHRHVNQNPKKLKKPLHDIIYLLIGFGALMGGAQMALKGSIQLGQIVGLSERVIGLTIVSVGTGLPELATSFVATLRRQNELAVANVIGSNIINTLGVPALAVIPGALFVEASLAHRDSYILLAITLFLFVVLKFNKGVLGCFSGVLFIGIYVGYLLCLI